MWKRSGMLRRNQMRSTRHFTKSEDGCGKVSVMRKTKRETRSSACGVRSSILLIAAKCARLSTDANSHCALWDLAGFAIRGVEGHVRHAPHVDADRRKNSAHAHTVDEPFLACHALPDFARPNDFADPTWE